MQLSLSNKVLLIILATVTAALLALAIYAYGKKSAYDNKLVDLQNEIALRDQTIEVQKGLYEKLAIQSDDLQGLLVSRDAEIVALKKEIEKKGQEVLTLTGLVVKWKKAYEAEAAANQVIIPPDPNTGGQERIKVEFKKDFGYIGVDGYTMTSPPYAWVRVQQNRPLKLSIAVTQDSDKVWHTYATSSEENVQIDVSLSSVNPWLNQPKWYEGISIDTVVGVGTSDAGAGFIAGVGASFKIGKFDLGPMFFVSVTDRVDKYVGLNFRWHPFAK